MVPIPIDYSLVADPPSIPEEVDALVPYSEMLPLLSDPGKANFIAMSESGEYECVTNSQTRMRPIQLEAIMHFMLNDGPLLVVFGTGVGKTLTALVSSLCYLQQHPDNRVVVIAPKSVQGNFFKEIKKYGAPEDILHSHFHFFTFHSFHNYQKKYGSSLCENSMIIIDEAHNYRSVKSTRLNQAFDCVHATNAKLMFLTATPFVNEITDLKVLTYMMFGKDYALSLAKEHMGSPWPWLDNHVIYQPKILTDDFPNLVENRVLVKMSDKYYNAMLMFFNRTNDNKFYMANRQLVNFLGEQEMMSGKLEYLAEDIQDKEGKLIIYTTFLEKGVRLIMDMLDSIGVTHSTITGENKSDERDETIRAFNTDQIRALIITEAGGEGVDLVGCEHVYVFDPVWNNAKLQQIIGRAVRLNSHAHLPPDRRVVYVQYLMYVEELDDGEDEFGLPARSISGDVILYRFIERKRLLETQIFEYLALASITNRDPVNWDGIDLS